jgi:hypothetical protein
MNGRVKKFTKAWAELIILVHAFYITNRYSGDALAV